MFYQEALHEFWPLSYVDSLVTIAERHWRKLVATLTGAAMVMLGAYFCKGGYNMFAVIKMGAYIHGAYFLQVLIYLVLR